MRQLEAGETKIDCSTPHEISRCASKVTLECFLLLLISGVKLLNC